MSLCGGGTPRAIYEGLVDQDVDWSQVVVTFGDERCVPPDHADSNYRMAREALLGKVPIPEGNVLRMRGELAPEEAAEELPQDAAPPVANNAAPTHPTP